MDLATSFEDSEVQQFQSHNSSGANSQQALYGARPQQTRNFSQRLLDTAYDSRDSMKQPYGNAEDTYSGNLVRNCGLSQGGKSGVFQPGGPQQALNRPSAQYANVYAERVMQLGVAVPSTAALLHMHAQQQLAHQQVAQQQSALGQLPQTVLYQTGYSGPISSGILAQHTYRPETNVIARAAVSASAPIFPNLVQNIQPAVGHPVPLAQLMLRPAMIAVATLQPGAAAPYAGHAAHPRPTSSGTSEGSTAATHGSPDYTNGAPAKRQALPPVGTSSSGASEDTQSAFDSQYTPGYHVPYYSSISKDTTSPSMCVYGMQMYVYRPVSYPDHISMDALIAANDLMSRLTIPGDIKYVPVRPDGKLLMEGRKFGFTAAAIALGSSYFQRLLAVMPHLEYAVRRSGGGFGEYVDALPACSQRRWKHLHDKYGGSYGHSNQVHEDSTLSSIQFTCCYLACKVVDRVPMLEMLRFILTTLYGSVVSKGQAYDVESKCLEGLEFRLGPYFRIDDMVDDWPF